MSNPLPIDQVILGDCVDVMNALPERSVDLIFADPPYNMQLSGELLRPDHSKVDAVDDEWDKFDSFAEYDDFTRRWLAAARRILKDTGTIWVIGTYHNIYRVGASLMDLGFWILNDIVWVKHNPTPHMRGVRFCNAHETLLWAKRSEKDRNYTFHYREMKSGNEDRQMRSDWYFPICSGNEREEANGSKAHTTQKPEALLHRVLAATSNPGDIVFDPFCGTGTTAAVAKRSGRHFITVDREPDYVEVARRRLARIAPVIEPAGHATLIDAPRQKIAFVSLVEAGLLPPGSELSLAQTGIKAQVHADGTLSARGYRGSIHKVGKQLLGTPSCNGWSHWYFHDPKSGRERPIDELRTPQRKGNDGGQVAFSF